MRPDARRPVPDRPAMKIVVAILIALLASLAHAGQAAEQVNAYFDLWFKQHQFHAYEKRDDGLRFSANGARLDGEINEVNRLKDGKAYTVESRVSLTFADGRRLDDFVAGFGKDPDDAFVDSLQNFCLTTLHPIYAELFDHADPHVRKDTWTLAGKPRRVFLSPWGQRGEPVNAAAQAAVERLLARDLADAGLSDAIHWLKVVVLVSKDKVETIVVTVDGITEPTITRHLLAFDWPRPKTFTMSKLFLVVGQR
jgi:hypothetical protein